MTTFKVFHKNVSVECCVILYSSSYHFPLTILRLRWLSHSLLSPEHKLNTPKKQMLTYEKKQHTCFDSSWHFSHSPSTILT